MRRSGIAIIGALFVAYALSGCESPADGVLRIGMRSNPITLDPRFATDAASTRINRLLYRRLVDFDDAYQPIPELASWQRLQPNHYRFRLRQHDVRFHDGSLLTTEDIKATYAFVLDSANASPHRGALKGIDTITIIDAHTIDFVLTKPDPLFPGRLVIGILPAAHIKTGHAFVRDPIGSAGFSFSDWEAGRLQLTRRRDGQVFEFVYVPDPTIRVLKLMRGEIDMLQGDLPFELVNWLNSRDEVKVTTRSGSNFAYLGFNLEDPLTGDRRLRQAIAYAIDREEIIKHILGDFAVPASALLPPDHWAGNPLLPFFKPNLQSARALLAKAGYSDSNPARIVYKTSNDPQRIRIATVLQDQLARVGIEVDVRTYDWGTFYGDIKEGRFQMYSLAWVGIKMPDIFRYTMHSNAVPPSGANRSRFYDQRSDDLIEQAEAATTLAEQAHYYRELQALLLQELPYVPLWYEDQVFISAADKHGFTVARDGNYDGLAHVVTR